MRKLTLLAAFALAATTARAQTIQATSTTMLTIGQQARGGVPGQEPDLVTVAPAFEILSVSARGIRNPLADDLEIVVSTWGSWELADPRWDAGTTSDLNGDVVTGYVRGKLLKRRLSVTAGRAMVSMGASRFLQLDGGEASMRLPLGFQLQAYGGSPVSQRFQSREGPKSWNPAGGDVAFGGRVGWSTFWPGASGKGLDVGAFTSWVLDGDDTARDDVGGDFRFQPLGNLTFSGFGVFSLTEERLGDATVQAFWSLSRAVHLTADWRYTAPDLMLPRTSILAVFADSNRNSLGGGATWNATENLTLGADAHVVIEPGDQPGDDSYGWEAVLRADLTRGAGIYGAELSSLDSYENGYVGARVYARREFGPAFGAADVLAHFFREDVNDESLALTGILTAGYRIGGGWSAVVSGRAGMNPFFEQQYDAMVKLAYNQTYTVREVRP